MAIAAHYLYFLYLMNIYNFLYLMNLLYSYKYNSDDGRHVGDLHAKIKCETKGCYCWLNTI